MRLLARALTATAVVALPLLPAAPAGAYEYGCSGTYVAVGSASQTCQFVYLGGSVTIRIEVEGSEWGLKYGTIGLYPSGSHVPYAPPCETGDVYGYYSTCSATFTPNASIGTLMTCSSGAAARPSGWVRYSCR